MSHFSVFVITDDKPTEDDLGRILQPWHEFECTGEDDEYIVDVDKTEETRESYKRETVKRLRNKETGELADPYEDRFLRETTKGESSTEYHAKVRHVPPQWEEVAVQVSDTLTEAEWAAGWYGAEVVHDINEVDLQGKHKYGYVLATSGGEIVKLVDRTNPEKKWDWWTVGGRWTGKLTSYDPESDPGNKEICSQCHGTGKRNDALGLEARAKDPSYTCNGCDGKGVSVKWPTAWKKYAGDQMQLKNIPLKQMRANAEQKALKLWDKARGIIAGRPLPSWKELTKDGDYAGAREVFASDPVLADLKKAGLADDWDARWSDAFALSREDAAATARNSALCPFAVVMDGRWSERGEMGRWGVVRDEKNEADWAAEFSKMLDGLSPDKWLTVVDCHI